MEIGDARAIDNSFTPQSSIHPPPSQELRRIDKTPRLLGPRHVDFRMEGKVEIEASRAGFRGSDDNEIRQPPWLFLLVAFNHRLEVFLPAEEIEWRAFP